MNAIKSVGLLLILLVQGCVQTVEMRSDFVDLESAEVISVGDKEFLRLRGEFFQSSSLSEKKVSIERAGDRAQVNLFLGPVAQGEDNLFEAMIPFDDGLNEVWLGSPAKRVWIRGKGLLREERHGKLPRAIPPVKRN